MKDIYILGAGAMGCLWATYFNDANRYRVTLIVRDPSAWASGPAHIECQPDNLTVPVRVITAAQATNIDHLIVATKAQHALRAVMALRDQLSDKAQLVLVQNGMGSQQSVAAEFDHLAVYACSSTEGAYKNSTHQLVHAGRGENHIGALTPHAQSTALQTWLPERLYQWHNTIDPILWRKLVINAAINPLTVLYRCQNGQLLENPQAQQHMAQLCTEMDKLLHTLQLPISDTLTLAQQVCRNTAQNFSSMYKDAEAGRTTEIDFINGYVVDQAKRVGLDCPTHQSVITAVKNISH